MNKIRKTTDREIAQSPDKGKRIMAGRIIAVSICLTAVDDSSALATNVDKLRRP